MVHGSGQPDARRARRLGRRRDATGATPAAVGLPRARTQADTWFDAWLAGDAPRRPLRLPEGWTVLHDLHRPGRPGVTIERVLVGPGGVVVLETVRWPGEVAVVGGTLRHQGYGRTPDVAGVSESAGAVTALLAPTHRGAVRAVLRLTGHDLDAVQVRGGAVALGEDQLAPYLTALPERLSTPDVALVAEYLSAELDGPAAPDQLTVDDVFRSPAAPPAPEVPHPRATPGGTGTAGTGPQPAVEHAPQYPAHVNPPGHPDQEPDRPAAGATRGPVGEGLLRVGLVVLGLLTVGNVLLAWLDAAG